MPIIDLQHISFNFGSYWAVKDVSFTLDKGDFLYVTGPSGAGKTSLLRLLFGALPVARGRAEVAGVTLNTLSPATLPLLRRQVSFVYQDFKIMHHRTVAQNVALALQVRMMPRDQIERRVRAVLRSLQLESKADMLCSELSGGEQQRVAVARAIVVNPQVIMADEPTGNLDPELSLRLMEIFSHFNAFGATVILATHSPELLRHQPRAKRIKLSFGKIVAANWPGCVVHPE